jgi:hypothetical protein
VASARTLVSMPSCSRNGSRSRAEKTFKMEISLLAADELAGGEGGGKERGEEKKNCCNVMRRMEILRSPALIYSMQI